MRTEDQDELIPTRRSLLSRLKDWDDQESWRDFFNTYWKLIYGVASKAGLTDAEAQDVVQETVVTIAKKMGSLKYDPAVGSFKGWLLNTTRWKIGDQFRKRKNAAQPSAGGPGDGRRTATIERIPDPAAFDTDSVWDEEWDKNLMDAAINRVKGRVTPKQYQIFDLYVIKNWPVAKVMRTLSVSRTQVYLAKHRIADLIRRELAALRKKFL